MQVKWNKKITSSL